MKQHILFLTRTHPPEKEGYYYVRLKEDRTKPIFPAWCIIVKDKVFIMVMSSPIPAGYYDFFGPLPELREANS